MFRPSGKIQVTSDSYTRVKSTSIPTIKSSQFWCCNTKTNLISIPTLKWSLFRPPLKPSQSLDRNQAKCDPHINQGNFDPNTRSKLFSTPTQKPCQFWSPRNKQVNFDHHSKTKLISIQRLTPSYFRPSTKNHANYDPYNEIKSSPIPTTKWSQFRPPTQNRSLVRCKH